MRMLVYGIVAAGEVDPWGRGLDNQPMRGITEGPLEAIVSDHARRPPESTAAALRAYESAVRCLMDRGAILPAQFGSLLADADAVKAFLRTRRDDLLARLERVRGAVEVGVRANWRGGALLDPGPTADGSHLRHRLELRQWARRVAHELDPLMTLARGSRRALPRPDLPMLDAYLVDRGRVREFVAMVEQLDNRLEDVELESTGPWPPYSFAQGAPVTSWNASGQMLDPVQPTLERTAVA
jgi:Gas vesicle synthesis protein GvpL/GvpF